MRARDIMSKPVVTTTPDTTVKHAADVLAAHRFTALPVVDAGNRLIGIVTEVDLVRNRFPRDARYRNLFEDDRRLLADSSTVDTVMSAPVHAMPRNADVVDVAKIMVERHLRVVPIVDDHRVVGIITRGDLVRLLARPDEQIAADVRHKLARCSGPTRWTVRVHDGEVVIGDEYADETERHVAIVLAESVPGVTRASVVSRAELDTEPA